ncbi:MAG: hypothetical protein HJJLKODD_00096 [Phycisphaerae bacterium]|nr:hypothetical protein [Phycisphaerae bacterium]
MRQQPLKHNGFTLVEMLVAIGIIVVLLSILLPSLSSARIQSRLVACQANMRTIGEQVTAYSLENKDLFPRGPSHSGSPNPLLNVDVATNQIWMGNSFMGTPWINPGSATTYEAPPQYVGLGLLSRKSDRRANQFLYCPADDQLDIRQEVPKIGQTGEDAYCSYLFRQLDFTPPEILITAKLNDLRKNTVQIKGTSVDPPKPVELDVTMLAMDINLWGDNGIIPKRTNHNGTFVNISFVDGSVQQYENQNHVGWGAGLERPWASLDIAAFPGPATVLAELDRIIQTADIGYKNPTPWLVFVP